MDNCATKIIQVDSVCVCVGLVVCAAAAAEDEDDDEEEVKKLLRSDRPWMC